MNRKVIERIVTLAIQHDSVGSWTEVDEEGNEIDNREFLRQYEAKIDEVEEAFFAIVVEEFVARWRDR